MSSPENKISRNTVVAFHYVLRDESGQQIETSSPDEPMVYLHGGYRNLLPALEMELEGKAPGENLTVTLPPEKAYGLRREGAVQRVPIKHLLGRRKKYQPGDFVRVNTQDGPKDVVVIKAGRFNVDVDTNHPFAGRTLTFDIKIKDLREATPEEISHGHSHGWDGAAHHH